MNPKIENRETVHNFCVGSACEHAWFSKENPETSREMEGETGEEREFTRVPREYVLSTFQFSLFHKKNDCFTVYQKKIFVFYNLQFSGKGARALESTAQ